MNDAPVSILRDDLLAALSKAATAVPTAKKDQICGSAWFDASGRTHGLVTITATDGTLDVHCRLAAAPGFTPFQCGLPAKKFLELLSRLPSAPITLSPDQDTGMLRLRCGRTRASLPMTDWRYAPNLEPLPKTTHPIDPAPLAAAIAAAAPSAGDGEEGLDQVRFTPFGDAGVLRVEALDGHQFVRVDVPGQGGASGWWQAVPDAFGVEARRMAVGVKWIETAQAMAVSDKRLFFVDAVGWWSLPVRRGIWVETDRLMAKVEDDYCIDVRVNLLAEAAERLAIYLPEGSKNMCLTLGQGDASLCLPAMRGFEPLETQERSVPQTLRIVVPGMEFGRFLRRAPSETVRLCCGGPLHPIGVFPLHDGGQFKAGWSGIFVGCEDDVAAYTSEEAA